MENALTRIPQLCGYAVALLGTSVMVGWMANIPALVQLDPTFAPMQFNTALAFVLSGGALLLTLSHHRIMATLLAAVVFAFGLLVSAQYALDVTVGIDELFIKPQITTHTSHPGRPSPIAALCFSLIAVSTLIAGTRSHWRHKMMTVAILACLTASISITTIAGDLSGIPAAFGWGQWTRMALHTAVGFFALGLGWFAWAWRNVRTPSGRLPRWLPVPIVMGLAFGTVFMWQSVESEQQNALSREITAATSEAVNAVRAAADSHLRALDRMAKRWEVAGRPSRAVWEADAMNYLSDYPALRRVHWIDTEDIIRWSVPSTGSEWFIGSKAASEPHRRAALDEARATHDGVLFRASSEPSGEIFLVYIPLYRSNDFDGFLAAAMRVDGYFSAVFHDGVAHGYWLQVKDGERVLYARGTQPGRTALYFSHLAAIKIGNASLQLAVAPADGRYSELTPPTPGLVLAIGGVITMLTTWALLLMLRAHDESIEKTKAQEALHQLNNELDAMVGELTAANAELEAFAYTIAHDLRAPLRHITGFAELLRKHSGRSLDAEGSRLLEIIHNAAAKQTKLIGNLLLYAKTGQQALKIETVQLTPLVQDIRHELSLALGPGDATAWRTASLPGVIGDTVLLRQVFYNLLSNAVKFTRKTERPIIEIGVQRGELSRVIAFVRDNGAGFDMRYAGNLFGVFQRLHNNKEFEGTGIGLAHVRRIVQRLGGRVWGEGKVNEGATFYVDLPRGENQA